MKTLKDVKPGDKVFILNSNRGYLKEPQIETLTVNKCDAGRSGNRFIYD